MCTILQEKNIYPILDPILIKFLLDVPKVLFYLIAKCIKEGDCCGE